MRSVILDKHKINMCGICEAKKPYIEYIEKEGVPFIWCKKCHTISFFKPVENKKKDRIEKEMNAYMHHREELITKRERELFSIIPPVNK